MGMIEMIALIVGSSSTAAAWTVHLVVSAVIGAGVGLVLDSRGTSVPMGSAQSHLRRLWWILGPLLLMPARLGVPVLAVTPDAWKSMMGHLIFGAV